MKEYGKELILDLHNCDNLTFTRKSIAEYFKELCRIIDMQPCEMHFWDDFDTPNNEKQTSPHTVGTSAIQFILTSNITIHTLDLLKSVYVNVFSCKDFDTHIATEFTASWFKGSVVNSQIVTRY